MRKPILNALLCAALAWIIAWQAAAQQPSSNQLVIQAANAPGAQTPPATAAIKTSSADDATLQTLWKELQEAKKRNEELMKKQEATLQALDELQKAAEQLKVFSKRV